MSKESKAAKNKGTTGEPVEKKPKNIDITFVSPDDVETASEVTQEAREEAYVPAENQKDLQHLKGISGIIQASIQGHFRKMTKQEALALIAPGHGCTATAIDHPTNPELFALNLHRNGVDCRCPYDQYEWL